MYPDDSDPVVKEIPVYLAKGLVDKLSIFQYPLRSPLEGYDKAEFLKTQIKPNTREVQMDLALDIDSENYDISTGEHIVLNMDKGRGDQDEENKIFPSNYMDRIILKSSRALPKCDNYAIAVHQDGELHITTLNSILQIRPRFNHFDVNEKRSKDDSKNVGDDEEEDDTPKQVNVSFARNLPEHILKRMREQSFVHQSQNSTEQFIETQYHGATTSKAELTRLEMFCQAMEERANNFSSVTKKQYLDLIVPVAKEDKYNKIETPNTSSLNCICTLTDMPLLDHIRILLKHAKVISFSQLRSIITLEHETHAILKYLQQVAVLVQGNWIVNSELEYPKDTKSSQSGIPAELMCRARDYILLLFTEYEYVDRKAISSVIKLPSEEIKEILINIAKHQPKKGWHLIIPASKDFIERYSDISQRQEMFWDAKRKQLQESMKSQTHTPQRQRRRSNRESTGSENEERNVVRGKKSLNTMLT